MLPTRSQDLLPPYFPGDSTDRTVLVCNRKRGSGSPNSPRLCDFCSHVAAAARKNAHAEYCGNSIIRRVAFRTCFQRHSVLKLVQQPTCATRGAYVLICCVKTCTNVPFIFEGRKGCCAELEKQQIKRPASGAAIEVRRALLGSGRHFSETNDWCIELDPE